MRLAVAACVAVLWTGTFGGSADAFCVPVCPPVCCVTYEWRPVVCYRPEWQAEKVPCMVQRVNYRREVTPVKVQCWAPKWVDEPVRVSYYTPVPREVEREYARCVMIPVPWVDPCTGCCFVTYCPQWVKDRVRCVEYDYRRDEREERVRVCKWEPYWTSVDQVRWVPEVTQEPSWTIQYRCVMVPYQSMVCVPVCTWR